MSNGDYEKYSKTSDTQNLVKEKAVTGTEVIKMNVTALLSPDKNNNQENKSDDEVNSSIISVSEEDASSSNIVSVPEGKY